MSCSVVCDYSHKRAKDQVLQGDAGAGSNGAKDGDTLEGVLEGTGILKNALQHKVNN
jgi:hypothetical protein